MSVDQINWRSEFGALQPYFNGKGGVVHIRYRGIQCAPNAFLETLKSSFDNFVSQGPRASVRIDPMVSTTHYLVDILQAIAKKVGCKLETTKTVAPVINVGYGNTSGADMSIDIRDVQIDATDYLDAPLLRDRRIAQLSRATREFLSTGHFMIVLNDAAPEEQAPFWHELWDSGFKELVGQGLLLVKMIDDEKQRNTKHPDEPEPERRLSLPTEYDEPRQQDAIADLANILIREVKRERNIDLSLQSAILSVRGVVFAHKSDISRLHREWSGVLMDLVKNAS